jgi:hypothetical protein
VLAVYSLVFNCVYESKTLCLFAAENSYSHHSDTKIGVSVIDRFTYYTQRFFSDIDLDSTVNMESWLQELTFERLHSTIVTKCVHSSGELPVSVPAHSLYAVGWQTERPKFTILQ